MELIYNCPPIRIDIRKDGKGYDLTIKDYSVILPLKALEELAKMHTSIMFTNNLRTYVKDIDQALGRNGTNFQTLHLAIAQARIEELERRLE